MSLETPQGRADVIRRASARGLTAAWSSPPKCSSSSRAVDARRRARGGRERCSTARARSPSIGVQLAAAPHERPDDDRRRAVGRLGPDRQRQRPEARALRPVTVVRPEPQAMWAPARDDWDPDATFVPGSDEEGGGRWVQHRPVPRAWPLARGDGPLPRLADAVPPPRLLPRHGAAMGLDARARARTPTCSTCSAIPASAPCC